MSLNALSASTVARYAQPAPIKAPPAAADAEATAKNAAKTADRSSHAPRENRLVQALGTALRELGVGVTATDSSASGADVDAAVQQFAHALLGALKPGGGRDGEQGDSGGGGGDDDKGRSGRGRGRGDGEGSGEGHSSGVSGTHGQHRGHHAGGSYGNLAQRLEALSKTVASTPDPATQPISLPGAPATDATAGDTPASAVSASPVAGDEPIRAAEATKATTTAPSALPDTSMPSPRSPLIDAFSKLFAVLQPQASAAASDADIAGKLQQFLHTLASSLGGASGSTAGGMASDAPAPTVGAFVDVSA